jgi:hypothetical protein
VVGTIHPVVAVWAATAGFFSAFRSGKKVAGSAFFVFSSFSFFCPAIAAAVAVS